MGLLEGIEKWRTVKLGMHCDYRTFIDEYVGVSSLSPLIQEVLLSLMIGYRILEYRLELWARRQRIGFIFDEQRSLCQKFEDLCQRDMTIPMSLELTKRLYLSLGCGTAMHHDHFDLGLSFVFYLGFEWGGCGFGLPEKKCVWTHGPGSALVVRGNTYWHMSAKPKNNDHSRYMGASFVKNIAKKFR